MTINQASLKNNTSSSIADLKILNEKEKDLLNNLEHAIDDMDIVIDTLKEDGYTIENILQSDVYNPVDSYNLIKRTSRTWTRIRKAFEEKKIDDRLIKLVDEKIEDFPNWEHSRIASALGLLNVQLYYDLEPEDLLYGKVIDKFNKIEYKANTRLNVGDVKLIAHVAEEEKQYSTALRWLKLFPQLRKRYKKLATIHNELVAFNPEEAVRKEIFTFDDTVDETLAHESQLVALQEIGRKQCPPFQG